MEKLVLEQRIKEIETDEAKEKSLIDKCIEQKSAEIKAKKSELRALELEHENYFRSLAKLYANTNLKVIGRIRVKDLKEALSKLYLEKKDTLTYIDEKNPCEIVVKPLTTIEYCNAEELKKRTLWLEVDIYTGYKTKIAMFTTQVKTNQIMADGHTFYDYLYIKKVDPRMSYINLDEDFSENAIINIHYGIIRKADETLRTAIEQCLIKLNNNVDL